MAGTSAQDGRRKRGFQVRPGIKRLAGPYQHICCRIHTPQPLIGQAALPPFGGGIVGNDHHQVIIAIGASVSSGLGSEKIDPFGLIGLHQPPHNLSEHGIAVECCIHPVTSAYI
jgi:hypothetical protein